MRPSKFRKNSLYHSIIRDSFESKQPSLQGFSYEGGWISIKDDGCFIHKADRQDNDAKGEPYSGFAWDGCTPKLKLGPLMFGTWDGHFDDERFMPQAIRAAKFHDALYQELAYLSHVGFTRRHADLLFREMLSKANFVYADLYYFGVRSFGGLDYRLWSMREKQNF